MNNEPIKPCPFCGKEPEIRQTTSGHGCNTFYATYKIRCSTCGIEFLGDSKFELVNGEPKTLSNGYTECIRKWNRRV